MMILKRVNAVIGHAFGRTIGRALRRAVIVGFAGIGLAGCYDVDATIVFKPEGTTAVTSRFDFPRDAKYIADLYRAIMTLQPEMEPYFDDGLCQSVEKLAAVNPTKPIELKAREYTTDQRFGCGFVYQAGNTATLIEQMKSAPGTTASVLKIDEVGPRQVRIEIDFNNMPDFAQMMPGLIMLGAMKYGRPGQGLPNMDAVNRIAKAYAGASLAMARMTAPNNHLQLAIAAAKIIDTNGERDGDIVKFRWSWEEFTRLLLKPADGKPVAKVFFAVVKY